MKPKCGVGGSATYSPGQMDRESFLLFDLFVPIALSVCLLSVLFALPNPKQDPNSRLTLRHLHSLFQWPSLLATTTTASPIYLYNLTPCSTTALFSSHELTEMHIIHPTPTVV